MIERWAPPHPPCWDSQQDWLEYLLWCRGSGEADMRPMTRAGEWDGSLPANAARRRIFNARLPFCRDCTPEHEARMCAEGRCEPAWLRDEIWKLRVMKDEPCDAA